MEGENEKEVCRLENAGVFFLIILFIENETRNDEGKKFACAIESGESILLTKPASYATSALFLTTKRKHAPIFTKQLNKA